MVHYIFAEYFMKYYIWTLSNIISWLQILLVLFVVVVVCIVGVVGISEKDKNLLKEVQILSEASTRPTTQFKCRNCDFETTSEKGLKQHNSKKHTKTENMGRRFECEHCKYGFNSKETLAVHIGKIHTKDF